MSLKLTLSFKMKPMDGDYANNTGVLTVYHDDLQTSMIIQ